MTKRRSKSKSKSKRGQPPSPESLVATLPAAVVADLRSIMREKAIAYVVTKETLEDYPLLARVQNLTIEQLALQKFILRLHDDSRPNQQLAAVLETFVRIFGEAPKKVELAGKVGFHVMYDDQVADLVKGGK